MASVLNEIVLAVLFGGFLIALCTMAELISRRGPFRWSTRWPGALFALIGPAFAILVSLPLKALWSSLGIPPLVRIDLPGVFGEGLAVLLLLLIVDFLKYWEHRFEHRFLWPVHAVHHAEENLSAATSYSHPLQFVSLFFLIGVPLSLVDLGSVATPLWVAGITAMLELFIHSPTRVGLGPLRHLFVDAPYHRIHHSLEERHFDRNFAILFSFWDRLFGTMVMPEPGEWPDTGIREARSPRTVGELLLFPWRLWQAGRDDRAAATRTTLPPAATEANRQQALQQGSRQA